jgi:hypothetical protein
VVRELDSRDYPIGCIANGDLHRLLRIYAAVGPTAISVPWTFFLRDWHGLAGHQRFVERGAALDDLAVDWDLLTGVDAQPITNCDQVKRDFFLAAIRSQQHALVSRRVISVV